MSRETQKKIKIEKITKGYDGFFKIDLFDFRHTLFQGGWSHSIRRELFGRGQAAVVLLYDPAKERVILIEQCRAGALRHALKSNDASQAWLQEPVAGMIDPGEGIEEAARREAREEAGVEMAELEFICHFYPSPGGSDEILHLYASQVDSDRLPDYAGLSDDHEDIRILKIPFDQARQALVKGEYNVASTIIALQWLFFQKLAF